VDGVATDVRVAVKAMLPIVFEPVPHEVMCFGVQFENSDYGKGGLYVRPFMWRLWCINRATMEDALSQIHLGKRMTDADVYSAKTMQLDLDTHQSAIGDIVQRYLGAEKIGAMCETVRRADEQKITWRDVHKNLLSHLTKSEQEEAKKMFESDTVEIETLPQAKSNWRLSNIFSFMAGRANDGDRKIELERLAGRVIDTTARKVGLSEKAA
jgi:hypothetical protein